MRDIKRFSHIRRASVISPRFRHRARVRANCAGQLVGSSASCLRYDRVNIGESLLCVKRKTGPRRRLIERVPTTWLRRCVTCVIAAYIRHRRGPRKIAQNDAASQVYRLRIIFAIRGGSSLREHIPRIKETSARCIMLTNGYGAALACLHRHARNGNRRGTTAAFVSPSPEVYLCNYRERVKTRPCTPLCSLTLSPVRSTTANRLINSTPIARNERRRDARDVGFARWMFSLWLCEMRRAQRDDWLPS